MSQSEVNWIPLFVMRLVSEPLRHSHRHHPSCVARIIARQEGLLPDKKDYFQARGIISRHEGLLPDEKDHFQAWGLLPGTKDYCQEKTIISRH
jgi:hypothetical protein